jgi:hypothetical protein
MDKKLRKQLEQQLSTTIAYFLKKMDAATTAKMEKPIKSASKDLAKKFVRTKKEISDKQKAISTKVVALKAAGVKKEAAQVVKKVAKKVKTVTPAKKVATKKKTAAKKAENKD